MKQLPPHHRRFADVVLAIAFVLAGTLAAGCKNNEKTSGHASPVAAPGASAAAAAPISSGNTVRRESGSCLLLPPATCERNQPCKSSAAFAVDCPPDLLEAGEARPVSRRPRGKEAWLRVRPWLYFDAGKKACAYVTEMFCSPPGTFAQCTPSPAAVTVPCTRDDSGGTLDVAPFEYVDGTGACHKVAAMKCNFNQRGLCELPEGEIVACRDKP